MMTEHCDQLSPADSMIGQGNVDPTVNAAMKLLPAPAPAVQVTELSATHPVLSHFVNPTPLSIVYNAVPKSSPLTVTMDNPVAGWLVAATLDADPESNDTAS
eukprot:3093056-Rhodomonas_salina.2